MREVVPFCLEHDPNPPDFFAMCVKERLLEDMNFETMEDRLVEKFKAKREYEIEKREKKYYHENW